MSSFDWYPLQAQAGAKCQTLCTTPTRPCVGPLGDCSKHRLTACQSATLCNTTGWHTLLRPATSVQHKLISVNYTHAAQLCTAAMWLLMLHYM
jgi:hypothetical protein